MALSKKFSEEIDHAARVAGKYRLELLQYSGVIAVGASSRRRKGKLTGEAAIVVTVKQKLSLKALAGKGMKPLPRELDGVPVDVVELRKQVTDDAKNKRLQKAVALKDQITEKWIRMPNVTGVGAGVKITNGRFTGEICIQIFVVKKMSPAELKRKKITPVPKTINGFPTDVIETGVLTFTGTTGHRNDRFDPLVGGISIGTADGVFSHGTLGAICFDSANNRVALSNAHVLDTDLGADIVQPGTIGLNGFDIGFQLDVCNPLHFIRLDTPNTVGGSLLAGAAAAAAIAAAASDKIDPTREGQEATMPAPGAFTTMEYTKLRSHFTAFPLPGTNFKFKAEWKYERHTTKGVLTHSDAPQRENLHYLLFHKLLVDQKVYESDEKIRLLGIVIDSPERLKKEKLKHNCNRYYCVAHLYPIGMDLDFPVVLRPFDQQLLEPGNGSEGTSGSSMNDNLAHASAAGSYPGLLKQLSKEELKLLSDHRQYVCFYYAEVPAKLLPLGKWKKWMYVQTVNTVPEGTNPLIAAQIIGGLPVSKNMTSQLDVACGPFTFDDDGTALDFELI